MDRGSTGLGEGAKPPVLTRVPRPARGWSRAPHHRRRRALALVLLGLVLLVCALLVAGGGTDARTHAVAVRSPGGFFGQIQTLAGSGPASVGSAENAGIDRTLAYTPYVRLAGAQHRELALTFDDGPGPYTPEIT